MNIKLIQRKTEELFFKYRNYVQDVTFGKVGNFSQDSSLYENFDFKAFYFIFTLKNIPNIERDIFPLSIKVEDNRFDTHFIRGAVVKTLACDEPGYWDSTPPSNRNYQRPIQGGLAVTNEFSISVLGLGYYGTLGMVAIDNDTNSVVTISNNHVYANSDSYISSERQISNFNFLNNFFDANLRQPLSGNENFGKFKKYAQLRSYDSGGGGYINKVDAAVSTIRKEELDGTQNFDPDESWKQWLLVSNDGTLNLNIPGSYKWATTDEIDLILQNWSNGENIRLWYSGARFGAQGLPTDENFSSQQKMYLTGAGTASPAGYMNQASLGGTVVFQKLSFRATSDDLAEGEWCQSVSGGGNSGSAMIVQINGEYKIIGLNFAGTSYGNLSYGFEGHFSRIDDVAELLNVSEFTSETTNYSFSDENATEIIDIPYDGSFSSDDYLDVDGKRFWQVGVYVP